MRRFDAVIAEACGETPPDIRRRRELLELILDQMKDIAETDALRRVALAENLLYSDDEIE